MQTKLLSWISILTIVALLSGCETEQLESDTVRTSMAVPEESSQTGSATETAKQQAENETKAAAESSAPTTTQAAVSSSQSATSTDAAVSYWDSKPVETVKNTSNSVNGGNFESEVTVSEVEPVPDTTASADAEAQTILGNSLIVPEETASVPAEEATPSLTLTQDDNKGSASVETNTMLLIKLPGNPTTGYTWSVKDYDTGILSLEGHDYTPTSSNQLGSGGTFTFQFKALTPGDSTITLEYARPWEKDVPPASTFSIDITVE